MNAQQQELVQAWVDGQLDAADAREAAALVERDPACRALADNLRGFSRLLRDNPPLRPVPESREFYWATIRRGIEQAERTRERETRTAAARPSPWRWIPWFFPAAAASLALFLALRPSDPASPPLAGSPVPRLAEHRIAAETDQLTTLTFYSAQDAMTVVWLGEVDLL